MKALSLMTLLVSATAMIYRLPPQCFDDWQCQFARVDQPYGALWQWDLSQLCMQAGSEYVAYPLPLPAVSPAPGQYIQRVRAA